MMKFRAAKASIEEILIAGSADCYRVIGYQHQQTGADEVDNLNRTVQVFYSSGDFPKSSGRLTGSTQHDIIYRLDLMVSAQTQGDVSTLNSPMSLPAEKSIALDAFLEAGNVADNSLDELIELIYQVLMDPQNYDMGQTKGTVSSRWIDQVQKDQPIDRGELVVLTASMFMRLRTSEDITGESGTAGDIQEVVVDIEGDEVEKTGVIIND